MGSLLIPGINHSVSHPTAHSNSKRFAAYRMGCFHSHRQKMLQIEADAEMERKRIFRRYSVRNLNLTVRESLASDRLSNDSSSATATDTELPTQQQSRELYT